MPTTSTLDFIRNGSTLPDSDEISRQHPKIFHPVYTFKFIPDDFSSQFQLENHPFRVDTLSFG